MTELKVASIPMLNMLQKACETLVVDNMINLPHTYNVSDRTALLTETQQANEMVEHIRNMLRDLNHDKDIEDVSRMGV